MRSRTTIVACAALTACFFIALVIIASQPKTSANPIILSSAILAPEPQPIATTLVSSTQLVDTLMRIRLDPSSLAAAGLSSQDVTGLIVVSRETLNPIYDGLAAADRDCADAQAVVIALERKVQAGLADENEPSQLATARSSLLTDVAQRDGAINELFADAVANLSTDKKDRLARIRANASWELPAPYLVVDRTESEWVALRSALLHERWALANAQSVDSEAQQLLAQVRAVPAVAAALANAANNGTAIATAWQQATTASP